MTGASQRLESGEILVLEETLFELSDAERKLLFSDSVSHAVRSGRGALEQTYFVPREALCMPERAPASILESHWRRSAR